MASTSLPSVSGIARAAPAPAVGPVVLVAEDDDELRLLLCMRLSARGYRVVAARDGDEAIERLEPLISRCPGTLRPRLVITDVRMPGFDGLQVLETVRLLDRSLPVVVITAFGDRETHRAARLLDVTAVFDKPLDLGCLVAALERFLPATRD